MSNKKLDSDVSESKLKEIKFTKDKILQSSKYNDKKDLINALLNDNQRYTKEQIDKLLKEYLNKEVK